jgi:hypothetical protein
MKRILLLSILLGFATTGMFAQQFEVSPSKIMFELEPGTSGTQYITVINKSSSKKSYIVETSHWTVDAEGAVKYIESVDRRSCLEWMNITPAFFDLGPNETERIAINMNVPDTALITKWAMLFVREAVEQTSALAADKTLKTGIVISPSIAVYIFQTPSSNNSINAAIHDLVKYESPENDAKMVKAMVTNNCDRIIICKVFLEILDLQTAEELSVDPIEIMVLPGVSKPVIFELPENMGAGSYDVTALLDYGNDDELVATQLELVLE